MKYKLKNRRYIGSKNKLLNFINNVMIAENIKFSSFADMFAGTGVVADFFLKKDKKVFVNDFLYSNYVFYNAWFSNKKYSTKVIERYLEFYNSINFPTEDNYFSKNFSGTYFTFNLAKKIGSIRNHIETIKDTITEREYFILLSSLLYTVDKTANTVGHFEAFLSSPPKEKDFILRELEFERYKFSPKIFNEDTNSLMKNIKADVVYLDPPYNSRQYINFYHLLENLAEWKKKPVFGKTLKMEREDKKSDYSKVKAKVVFKDLVSKIKAKYILVSYNNTYKANSGASINKISADEIIEILGKIGNVTIHEQDYKSFNSGKTFFNNHKELIYCCKLFNN